MSNREWMDQALCAQTDPELFFPDEGRGYSDAKKICAACPVSDECGDFAQALEGDLSSVYRHGTWAGQAPQGRAQIAKGRAA